MKEPITLTYEGGPADLGELDSYEAAGHIVAFSDLVGVCARELNLERSNLRTTVTAAKSGSFSLEFAIEISGVVATLFSGPLTVPEIFSLMKDSFGAFRALKGEKPTETKVEGNQVRITTESGNVVYMEKPVFNVVSDDATGRAVERMIQDPLMAGVSRVRMNAPEYGEVADIVEGEAGSFGAIVTETPIIDSTTKIALLIISPIFKEGKKWRFSDGQANFWAAIEDQEFLRAIDAGEQFAKGDKLIVDLRVVQNQEGNRLVTVRTVIKVYEHLRQEPEPTLPI